MAKRSGRWGGSDAHSKGKREVNDTQPLTRTAMDRSCLRLAKSDSNRGERVTRLRERFYKTHILLINACPLSLSPSKHTHTPQRHTHTLTHTHTHTCLLAIQSRALRTRTRLAMQRTVEFMCCKKVYRGTHFRTWRSLVHARSRTRTLASPVGRSSRSA